MLVFAGMPRRLTHAEEVEVGRLVRRANAGQARAERLSAERDARLAELKDSGVRVADIAEVLGVSRQKVYEMIERGWG